MEQNGKRRTEDQIPNPPIRPIPKFRQLARTLFFALAVTILIFGFYEIVERTWLTNTDMRLLHMLHLARGIVSSLVVAAIFSWVIFKTSPGFLTGSLAEKELSQTGRLAEEERTKNYAKWFIAMRWIAVLVAGLLVFITVQALELLTKEVLWPLIFTIVALAGTNLLYTFLIRWNRGSSTLLLLQGYLDLGILTVLLHFSGGVENPLSTMMIFHVIIGGILLSRRQCYGIAAFGSLMLALLIYVELAGIVDHYTLLVFPHSDHGEGLHHAAHQPVYAISRALLQTAILFLTAYFVTTLAERLRLNEIQLETMADRALEHRQLLERALETTGTALRVSTTDLQQCLANNQWNEWFICPPGTTCKGVEVLNGDHSPARQTLRDSQTRVTEITIESGECESESLEFEPKKRVFQLTTAPLRDVDGNVSQVVELAQDITQQKKTQTQLMRAGKLAAVGELAGQVAHEVNNPISIISAKAKLLLKGRRSEMSQKISEEIEKIRDLANRVGRIAQGLLSYCRPSTGKQFRLDIRSPIRKSLAMIEQHAQNVGVQISDGLKDLMPMIKGNANELEQVFLNLFLNALDAMPGGGRLSVFRHSDPVVMSNGSAGIAIVVEDTGTGISESIRERVFEPFFTTKKEGRGTGLGLSICSGLIRSHEGEVEVKSEIGTGTRFIVKLPINDSVRRQEEKSA